MTERVKAHLEEGMGCSGGRAVGGLAGPAGAAAGTASGAAADPAGGAGLGPQSHGPKPVRSDKHAWPPLHAPGPTHSRVSPNEQAEAGWAGAAAGSGLGESNERRGLAPSLVHTRCKRLVW